MEHQVFVPVPVDSLRAVLRDPARVARCVPGLQQDADAASGPLSGRLKLRVGGHTVTYRGALAVTERDPDRFAVDGEGTEIRGSGTVKLALTLRLTPEGHGTRLAITAGATADGRAAAFEPGATETAVRRLLDRAAAHLAAAAAPDPVAEAEAADAEDTDAEDTDEIIASVFETEVPPPSLDPFLEGDFDELGGTPRPPAEAAHARRTMIGRSAEEVDHAPPRGRYAPVPAPSATTAGQNLRWIAPAAALAIASAVVLGRALRRRH
ncbi:SRPBCC family protein [Streptomyces sp. APSN-46.1]|uniref:SRPBCC family protein n=1 Tax=Streptomyces sp. APSN-46.1 TaxID=2929049 RepID=UPI001FB38099|nr:SRPBCC domain-containing protein [Streptomyces sp. APSN-46.1]MCJ1678414.1 SRPBCC family protein [Streptomyces sp. APSN-46.1]